MIHPDFDRSRFERDGICWPMRLCSSEQAAGYARRYDEYQQAMVRVRGRENYIKPNLAARWLDQIVFNPTIVDTVTACVGPDIALWSSDFFVKAAGKGTYVSWHQDSPYWDLSTNNVVSVWLALTPSTHESGAMRAVPGSHHHGILRGIPIPKGADGKFVLHVLGKQKLTADKNLLGMDQAIDDLVDENDAVDVCLQPGEFSVHHVDLIHGGRPNRTDFDRIGFVMRFISSDTIIRAGIDSVLPVAGKKPDRDHFVFESRPTEDYSTASIDAMNLALSYPSGFGDKLLK